MAAVLKIGAQDAANESDLLTWGGQTWEVQHLETWQMEEAGDILADFPQTTITITRRAAASYSAGRVVAGVTSTLTISASVQSATGRDLLRLPEGRRSIDTSVVYVAASDGLTYDRAIVQVSQ